MKEATPIIEYGVPIDPRTMIEPPDPDTLELEPGIPVSATSGYVQRRAGLFARCRQHRLESLGPPLIDYTPEETRIWREVSPKLDSLHRRHACSMYLKAKDALGISASRDPAASCPQRTARTGHTHAPRSGGGSAGYRTFYGYIAGAAFPSRSSSATARTRSSRPSQT